MNIFTMIKKMMCKKQKRNYAPILYRKPETPEQNAKRLIKNMTQDFVQVRDRTDHQCLLFGRFLSFVLLIERKLVRLMSQFDVNIDDKMFGQKVDVFKEFLKVFDWNETDMEIDEFRALIGPMKEIKAIRDTMAHDLSKVSISYSEIRQTAGFIRSRRPDLYETFSEEEDENLRSVGAVSVFAFMFSEQIAAIQCQIQ